MSTDLIFLFKSIGLSEQKAEETAKNSKLSSVLSRYINYIQSGSSIVKIEKSVGTLLYQLSTSGLGDGLKAKQVIDLISQKKIKTSLQVKAASDYLKSTPESEINLSSLEKECGIGIYYSKEEIKTEIEQIINSGTLKTVNPGALTGMVLKKFKWADTTEVKQIVEEKLKSIDTNSIPKVNIKQDSKEVKTAAVEPQFSDYASLIARIDPCSVYSVGEAMKFHKPGENHKTEGYVVTPRNLELLSEHVKTYGLQVRTRFPPEPNGILHIGHAKAINFNFGYAKANNGVCFLRYDDTNAEKEEERFFIGILEAVKWLGFEPYKITYASDHFQWLYEQAKKLIIKGTAYVCHQPAEDMKGINAPISPWRDRPISESLKLFEDMKNGIIDEGKASLRVKFTMEDGKKDPVIYRIKFVPHHRTGNQWCIYPTYDYTHPLCDSLEGITHSLCTKEFQSHRSMYYWLCQMVDVYCPVQWEYGRLNMDYTVVSKRKIAKLIESKVVEDWDDPRLFTLSALKNRGVPAEAINLFCSKIGVTMASSTIHPDYLDHCILDVLNFTAPRCMSVLDPMKVVIENVDTKRNVSVLNFPADSSKGSHEITFDKVVYIEKEDFIENCEDSSYKRLTSNQNVGLRYVNLSIKLKEIIRKPDGVTIDHLVVTSQSIDPENKPKAFIHWVSDPVCCQVKIYDRLFIHPNPEDTSVVPSGFISDVNPNSLRVFENSVCDKSMLERIKNHSRFQFERQGFFYVDHNSLGSDKIRFSRIVSLKSK